MHVCAMYFWENKGLIVSQLEKKQQRKEQNQEAYAQSEQAKLCEFYKRIACINDELKTA